ncbi:hypothetical protein SHIRM173S_01817 [Streptomyces hirsutus]
MKRSAAVRLSATLATAALAAATGLVVSTSSASAAVTGSATGYATQNGGTTGGAGGQTVRATTGTAIHSALCSRASSSTPIIIEVQGTINHGNTTKVSGSSCNTAAGVIELKQISNVTIVGVGSGLDHSGVLFGIAACVALRFCLPGPDTEPAEGTEAKEAKEESRGKASAGGGRSAMTSRTRYVLAALVLIATAGTLVEDAGNSWAALYLSDSLNASAALAASGFIALVGAQFVGRIIGDRLVDRFGQRAVARAGGFIAAAGMGLALAVPTVPGTILGFAAAGFGVATLVPAAMHEADELPGLKPGSGLTIVSWLMRLGFLLSPPIVGLVADEAGLRLGLLVVPLAGALVVVLAGVLGARKRRPASDEGQESAAAR